jgi:hypothetical protein
MASSTDSYKYISGGELHPFFFLRREEGILLPRSISYAGVAHADVYIQSNTTTNH